jgi:hypothetical protein
MKNLKKHFSFAAFEIKALLALLSVFLFLPLSMNVFAQETKQKEKRMAAGVALELNMNSRENFAGDLALGFDYICLLPLPRLPWGLS